MSDVRLSKFQWTELMKRREFISFLGVLTLSLRAEAQQTSIPTIGFLSTFSSSPRIATAFLEGLAEVGLVEGRDFMIDYSYAEQQYELLSERARDMVRRRVSAILATGGSLPCRAAKAATSRIPIVFVTGGEDPVKDGLVDNLDRPGGNVTGIKVSSSSLNVKRLKLLHQLLPNARVVGVLINPNYGDAASQLRELQEAARTAKLSIRVENVDAKSDVEAAIETLRQQEVDALYIANDPYTNHRNRIISLCERHSLPAIYFTRDYPTAGGLMSYGADFADAHRQAGVYIGRILKGESPAVLPVLPSAKVEFVINLKTAKSLNLTIPDKLLHLADDVIH